MRVMPLGAQYGYRGRMRMQGLAGASAVPVPVSVARDVKRAGFLASVIPVRVNTSQLAGLGLTATAQAGLIGAGSQLVKTKNPTVSYAAQGASVGASVGSVVPVIGTAVGAIVGAVLGAIGGAFKGSRRPESDYWDDYKNQSGKYRGIEFDPQYLREAFVGLMRLGGKTQFPPKIKFGRNGDAAFLDAMAQTIADAVRAGKVGAEDDANSIWTRIVKPWGMTLGGDWDWGDPQWVKWQNRIVTDLIDQYIYDLPIVATSYTEGRKANPAISDVVNSLPQVAAPAPVPTTSVAPVPTPVSTNPNASVTLGPDIVGYAINAEYQPLYASTAGGQTVYLKTGSGPVPYVGPVSATPKNASLPVQSQPTTAVPTPVPQVIVTPTSTTPQVDVAALVQSLQAQGATQQQAFLSAMEALKAQGVTATPAVQQQVADQVQAAGGVGSVPSWLVPIIIGAGIVFALARPAKVKHGHH